MYAKRNLYKIILSYQFWAIRNVPHHTDALGALSDVLARMNTAEHLYVSYRN